MTDWPDNDPRSLRLCWLIAAFSTLRGAPEALVNAARLAPPTHWRSGVKLVRTF